MAGFVACLYHHRSLLWLTHQPLYTHLPLEPLVLGATIGHGVGGSPLWSFHRPNYASTTRIAAEPTPESWPPPGRGYWQESRAAGPEFALVRPFAVCSEVLDEHAAR